MSLLPSCIFVMDHIGSVERGGKYVWATAGLPKIALFKLEPLKRIF